jgi:hypothetical protein
MYTCMHVYSYVARAHTLMPPVVGQALILLVIEKCEYIYIYMYAYAYVSIVSEYEHWIVHCMVALTEKT